MTGPVHRRVGPGIEVALCGERGALKFAASLKFVNCEQCKARHQQTAQGGTDRFRKEMAARRAARRHGSWSKA